MKLTRNYQKQRISVDELMRYGFSHFADPLHKFFIRVMVCLFFLSIIGFFFSQTFCLSLIFLLLLPLIWEEACLFLGLYHRVGAYISFYMPSSLAVEITLAPNIRRTFQARKNFKHTPHAYYVHLAGEFAALMISMHETPEKYGFSQDTLVFAPVFTHILSERRAKQFGFTGYIPSRYVKIKMFIEGLAAGGWGVIGCRLFLFGHASWRAYFRSPGYYIAKVGDINVEAYRREVSKLTRKYPEMAGELFSNGIIRLIQPQSSGQF